MVLWLLGLPFAFVVTLGWWSIIVCSVVGYGKLSLPIDLVFHGLEISPPLKLCTSKSQDVEDASVVVRTNGGSRLLAFIRFALPDVAHAFCFYPNYCYPDLYRFKSPEENHSHAAIPIKFVGTLSDTNLLIPKSPSAELLGFETIGVEIENPFGRDYNDLPLDMVSFFYG